MCRSTMCHLNYSRKHNGYCFIRCFILSSILSSILLNNFSERSEKCTFLTFLRSVLLERMYRGVVLVRVWLSRLFVRVACMYMGAYMIFRLLFLEIHCRRIQFMWFLTSALRAPEKFHLSAPRSSQFCLKQRSALRGCMKIQRSSLH